MNKHDTKKVVAYIAKKYGNNTDRDKRYTYAVCVSGKPISEVMEEMMTKRQRELIEQLKGFGIVAHCHNSCISIEEDDGTAIYTIEEVVKIIKETTDQRTGNPG